MKRYFNMVSDKQVVMVEFVPNSVFRHMDISGVFNVEDASSIVEISKREYILLKAKYAKENATSLSLTITR